MVLAKLRRRWSASPGTPSPSPRGGFSLHPTPLDSGLVSGQVHDERGTLLPGASVTIVDRLNQTIGETKTDAYGGFVLSVAPGTHRLSLSAGGYRRFSTRVQVQVNQHSPLGSIGMQSDDSLQMPQPGRYRFDPYHTEIRFVAQHIGLSKIHGEFRRFDGVIDVAPRFEDSQIEVVMEAASIDTGVQMRDDHLRSADFLDVESHPRVLFRSERLTHVRADRWNVSGRLTLRGTTSPVELESVYLGQRQFQGPGFDGDLRVACDAKATLRREDYSVNWQATLAKGIAVVGPTISIELGVQAVME
ncbi:YceI family protein [Saccharopolyspora dendranthemae]|uniref:Polyisoprenoid-binding protein YceI n=1 Tax=Saccharopolyspora dendranthemae TaxID=1181886 RepID=A0A561U6H9_9PSEU|nr:YceI family protein [Saccharopolyspora dendranthemae]TWF94979.1 polyisoprenoid-binding protein YceI [Saccharopolyspora dendranthemae]